MARCAGPVKRSHAAAELLGPVGREAARLDPLEHQTRRILHRQHGGHARTAGRQPLEPRGLRPELGGVGGRPLLHEREPAGLELGTPRVVDGSAGDRLRGGDRLPEDASHPQLPDQGAAVPLDDLDDVGESVLTAVVGIRHVLLHPFAELAQQLHLRPGRFIRCQTEEVVAVGPVHRDQQVEALEILAGDLPGLPRQIDAPLRGSGYRARIRRVPDVPVAGAGALHLDLVVKVRSPRSGRA